MDRKHTIYYNWRGNWNSISSIKHDFFDTFYLERTKNVQNYTDRASGCDESNQSDNESDDEYRYTNDENSHSNDQNGHRNGQNGCNSGQNTNESDQNSDNEHAPLIHTS